MLTANAANDVWIALVTKLNAHLNQFCNTRINGCERIVWKNALCQVLRNKLSFNVVTRETERGLSEVVSTKAEEVCLRCNFISRNCSTRKLDHGTNRNLKLDTLLFCNLSNDLFSKFTKLCKFRNNRNQRNHDFRLRIKTFFLQLSCSSCNSANLHFRKNRELDCQTATTKTQHRILLAHAVDLLHKLTLLLDHIRIAARCLKTSNFNIQRTCALKELMQWWVKQTNDNWITIHCLEHTQEVTSLSFKQIVYCLFTNCFIFIQDEGLNDLLTIA